MRPMLPALCACVALVPAAGAADLRNFDDAPLRDVQFVDKAEGWAVGDEGVVWHTIDAGHTWERQPTGVRASLRSVHFLNPYTGWVAGREELPQGGGSTGVLLYTRDGGLTWQRVTLNTLPGLNRVRFVDHKTGYLAGDGSDQFPSGVFVTRDSGRTWEPLPGPRAPAWLAADFSAADAGALGGAWNRLAAVRGGKVTSADVDTLGGRSIFALQLQGNQGVAVGEGGLVLLKDDTPTPTWSYADLKLPAEVRANLDFRAVCVRGKHVWVAGRPGSVLLHSATGGNSWELVRTGQPLPLHGINFADEQHGWAVGELGQILATEDGGKTWKVQRRGGQRAALLFVHARAAGLPVDALAVLGGDEGYLAAALRVAAPDPASAAPGRAADGLRLAAAARQAGGAAGEMLWQFPLPQHLARADAAELVKSWDRLHADRAADELLRQLVLCIRVWRPDVILTDPPDAQDAAAPSEALVAEAVREAFKRAADPKAFPEQFKDLGLDAWRPAKLYGRCDGKAQAHAVLDLAGLRARLEGSARDFAGPAAALLSDSPVTLPAQRSYRLLESNVEGAGRGILDGVPALGPGGLARRELPPAKEPARDLVRAMQARRNLQALADAPAGGLVDGDKLISQLGPALERLPEYQAAQAGFGVATQFVRQGQWGLAREAFLLLAERYPAHPQTADALRWLIRHDSSSEARRRYDLKQFIVYTQVDFRVLPSPTPETTPPDPMPKAEGDKPKGRNDKAKPGIPHVKIDAAPDVVGQIQQARLLPGASGESARRWYKSSLDLEPRLAALGPLFAAEPSLQFCLQAARRNLGEFDAAQKWYGEFASRQPDGPWRAAALAELWLANRTGQPPKPVALCRQAEARPFLDGKLDEPCWAAAKVLTLKNAVGDTAKEYPTEAWLAYDAEFLYVAVRCKHPAGHYVAPVKPRPRDADVRPYDRVSLLLDLDRDYNTYFHLQIDQRGCACEDCWGDVRWNPRWFVAVQSDESGWTAEAAIPLTELTGDRVVAGHAWACNVVRVLPGRGVQAWSTPADVQPRPEGMGLLLFHRDPTPQAQPEPAVPMSKVP